MSAWSAFLLGVIQGITEWIPVSSQGVLTLASRWIDAASPADAIAIALWLHVGTAVSAAIAIRSDIAVAARNRRDDSGRLSAPIRFLSVSTAVTAIVGIPLFVLIDDSVDRLGAGGMLLIGLAMLVTAVLIRRRAWTGGRDRHDVGVTDALLVGAAQALAVFPGLSRTGLTVATLLARGCSHREAAVLSVLMGIPASLGAGVLAMLASETLFGWPAVIGALTAAIVGAGAIRFILVFAARVRLAPFVALTGAVIIIGAVAGLVS